jgi:hypothetical protein
MIDYVIVNRKYRSSVEDVRVRRGADIESDHMMVMAKMRLHLKGRKGKKERGMMKIDKTKLEDEKRVKEAQRVIGEEAVGGTDMGLEEDWERFKGTMQKINGMLQQKEKECRTGNLYQKRRRNYWKISVCLRLGKGRKPSDENEKEFKRVKRKLTKRLSADREKWWRTKAKELEKNMKRNNVEKVFEILNIRKKTR